MKVFVTGASGFVGTQVTKELLKHGYEVLGLARSDASAQKLKSLGATPHPGSLDDLASLTAGAKAADAVVHMAFIHDFLAPDHDFARNCATDIAALEALAEGVRGTNKVFINTHGTIVGKDGAVLTETTPKEPGLPRNASEDLFVKFGQEGLKAITIRLSPSVHGVGDPSFVPALIGGAKATGESIYVDENARWPSVSKYDAAVLYRLAIENAEKIPNGQFLHAIEDVSHLTKDIAELIGKKLGVPVKQVTMEEAIKRLGFIGYALSTNNLVTKEETEKLTGWKIKGNTLLEDIEENYF
ncbi:NAD-dependent epimerase/dehydratase [Zopfia rhizophila CBS 207.26]|uniref:NAD-dependent epimerase/dehydratase n=1 Tax=Zopfia rhizophila CBS 207.26 TaxID=1314779 RepID=A0A6A6DT24_9PEZI|nr:NAD-dependent epimerase/dehydratase [Zopfia rhizophila CBS 207.26]